MLYEPMLRADPLPAWAQPAPHAPVGAARTNLSRPRTTYGNDAARWPAALASAAIVVGLFSVLAWVNIAPPLARPPHIVAVTLKIDPPRPAPQPKRPAPPHPTRQTATPTPATPTPAAPLTSTPLPPAAIVPPAPTPAAAAPRAQAPAATPAPAPAAPAEAGDLSTHMLSFTPPAYPLDSRRAHESGTVVLTLLLAPDGTVGQIDIAQSSGHPRLDQAALAAVRTWRWKPTLRDGQPTQVRGTVRIPFILKS